MKYVFKTLSARRYRFPTHTNELVLDREDASCSEVFIVVLEPGEAPPPHTHPDTEQIFFVLEGEGCLRIGEAGEEFPVTPGDVVRIPPSVLHSIEAAGGTRLRYLAVDCFLGRPDEPSWDEHVKAICARHNWDYHRVLEA